jgi:hypothetical protein
MTAVLAAAVAPLVPTASLVDEDNARASFFRRDRRPAAGRAAA